MILSEFTSPTSEDIYLTHRAQQLQKLMTEAQIMDERGRGGIINLITHPKDIEESRAIVDLLRGRLGIETTDIKLLHVDDIVEPDRVLQKTRHIFGNQLPAHTIFDYRLVMDHLLPLGITLVNEKLKPQTTPEAPSLLILKHPVLHDAPDFEGERDFERVYKECKNMSRRSLAEAYLHSYILELISLGVYHEIINGQFGKNVVINHLDDSYLRFAVAGEGFSQAGFRPLSRVLRTSSMYTTISTPSEAVVEYQRRRITRVV